MPAKKTAPKTINKPLAAFGPLNGDMAKVFAQMQETYAKHTEAIREELARFTEARMQGTAQTFGDLAQCKNPLEAMGLQQQWLMGMSRAYVEEALKLAAMAGEALKKQQAEKRSD